jgi:peptidoglycan/xylan/chitin deacetylase (PgdA/CDA1 family)
MQRLPGPGAVALTFDDGPDPDATPLVLEALADVGAKATFFVLAEQVSRHERLAAAIAEAGHDLEVHGATHRRLDRLPVSQVDEEIARGVEGITRACGVRPRWFRPPYGRASTAVADVCARHGMGIAYWSASGYDWEPVDAPEIARAVAEDLGPGAIVLLHDSARYNRRDTARPTAEAIPLIHARAAGAGLRLTSLREAIPA